MKKAKNIIVRKIKWDTDGEKVTLPKKIVIPITEKTEYLLEDINGYAENLSDYLSDTYEYCHYGFSAKVEYENVDDTAGNKYFSVSLVYYDENNVPQNGATIYVVSEKDITKMPTHLIKENIFIEEELERNDCEGIGTIYEISEEEAFEECDDGFVVI